MNNNSIVYAEAYPINNVPFNKGLVNPSAPYSSLEPERNYDLPNGSIFPPINREGAKEFLSKYGWPVGLQNTLIKGLERIPIRYIICDDSGSMSLNDGKMLMVSGNASKRISCSRWNELTNSLTFHAKLAHAANAPTEFRLLNGGKPIMIGDGNDPDGIKLNRLLDLFNQSPHGATPLCKHLTEIVGEIQKIEQYLRNSSQKACLIIASDGQATDGKVSSAILPLKNLPCGIMVRLCTDDAKITDYWNDVDKELELDMDVLDDLYGEASEICVKNNWLTYGEPLHRLREFGVPVKELDFLDERSLTLDQIRSICSILFGERINDYPHPEADFKGFREKLNKKLLETGKLANPMSNKFEDWILINKLPKTSDNFTCCIIS